MRIRLPSSLTALGCGLALALSSVAASASERHFTYTYESAVLSPGHVELEPWTTFQAGRTNYYTRMEQRLELEFGLVPNLQTSIYWNMSATAQDVDSGAGLVRQKDYQVGSISNEWKYKLSDPLADALGSALYFEWAASPTNAELEGKLILDKRMGDALIAFNGVGEYGWDFADRNKTEKELELEADLAFAWFVTEKFTVGLELRNVNEMEDGDELESSTLYAGPVMSVAQKGYWFALTLTPQVAALKGATRAGLDLEHQQRLESRLVFGVDLGG